MKKIAIIMMVAVLAVALISCGGSDASAKEVSGPAEGQAPEEQAPVEEPKVVINERDATEAFAVSLMAVMFASFQSAFGEAPGGATLSEDNLVLTMENMPLTDFEGSAYTSISGTASNNGDGMDCDLTLEGDGPVETIQYTIESFDQEIVEANVIVNGEEMLLSLDEEALQS